MANPAPEQSIRLVARHQYDMGDYRVMAMHLPPTPELKAMDEAQLFNALRRAQKHLPVERQRSSKSLLRTCVEKAYAVVEGVERARQPAAKLRPVPAAPAPTTEHRPLTLEDLESLLPRLQALIRDAMVEALAGVEAVVVAKPPVANTDEAIHRILHGDS